MDKLVMIKKDELLHYNHNHDAKGRFARGVGSAAGGIRVAASKGNRAANKARTRHAVKKAVKKTTKRLNAEHEEAMNKLREEYEEKVARAQNEPRGSYNSRAVMKTKKLSDMTDNEVRAARDRLENEAKIRDAMYKQKPSKRLKDKGINKLIDIGVDRTGNVLGDYWERELRIATGVQKQSKPSVKKGKKLSHEDFGDELLHYNH